MQDRSLEPGDFDDVDASVDFPGREVWAGIKTVSGSTFFDGVNQDITITHHIMIRHDDTISRDQFIQLADGRRLRIVNVEAWDERAEYMRLVCTDRGLNEAAKA